MYACLQNQLVDLDSTMRLVAQTAFDAGPSGLSRSKVGWVGTACSTRTTSKPSIHQVDVNTWEGDSATEVKVTRHRR